MRVLRAGREAVLVELDDLASVLALHAVLRRDPPAGVVDLVPAARTVLLTFDASTTAARVAEAVSARRSAPSGTPDAGGPEVEVAVRYDGEDLAEVASLTGLSESEIVARHVAGEYLVAFSGFAPGFAYCVRTAGGEGLRVPRRDTPRTRVPAGSVALADEFTGVYPREGPGGWQLIGRTDAGLWDLERDPPALLAPGTRVRFREAAT